MDEPRGDRLGPTRADVLEFLRARGERYPVSAIAAAVGLHPNTTRFHLDALHAIGLVLRESEHRETPGRPKVLYRAATVVRDPSYKDLAQVLVRHLAAGLADRKERAVEAGRAWGEEMRAELGQVHPDWAPLDRLVGGLTELGYEPQMVGGPEPYLAVKPCPYQQVAAEDPDVVCQLHLGLMRGMLGTDQPWNVVSIEPFVTPTMCRVALAHAGADGQRLPDA